MDPITGGIAMMAVGGVMSSAMQGIAGYSQGKVEQQTAQYNAASAMQQGQQAQQAAAATEAQQLRKSQGELGAQAAAFGQANVGTGPTVQGLERQSATDERLKALNIWYGGRVQGVEALNQARLDEYQARAASSKATGALIGAGVGAGTSLLMGGAQQLKYSSTGVAPTF
jgi:hypothetical protein